jgi:hypothetical protein
MNFVLDFGRMPTSNADPLAANVIREAWSSSHLEGIGKSSHVLIT